ncbi:hypothetical protein FQA39_LY04840 [Lamprigera yunnana]|nr:hypothetical protein FQA39_LY04840 [Lamprigera yunnana]
MPKYALVLGETETSNENEAKTLEMGFVVILMCLNIGEFSLKVPYPKSGLKNCVKNVIENIVGVDTPVVFVYYETFNIDFPDEIQNPYMIIDIRTFHPISNFEDRESLYIITIHDYKETRTYFKFLNNLGIWNQKTAPTYTHLIMVSLEDMDDLEHMFLVLWQHDVINAIVMQYDTSFKNDSIRLFTSDPQHPQNKCGMVLDYVQNYTCGTIQKIQFPHVLRKYHNCELSYLFINLISKEATFKSVSVLTTSNDITLMILTFRIQLETFVDSVLTGTTIQALSTRPGSYIEISIRTIVTILIESGMLDDMVESYVESAQSCIEKKKSTEDPIVLTLYHVYPIFVFWGIGLIVGTIVFLIELLIFKSLKIH